MTSVALNGSANAGKMKDLRRAYDDRLSEFDHRPGQDKKSPLSPGCATPAVRLLMQPITLDDGAWVGCSMRCARSADQAIPSWMSPVGDALTRGSL
jgi:hypothetical protein